MAIQSNNIVNSGSLIMSNALSNPTFFRPSYSIEGVTSSAVLNSAYFTFLGKTTVAFTPLKLILAVTTNGTGTTSNALGLFSTTSAPNGSNLVMTPLVTTSALTYTSASARINNTTNFNIKIPAGTFLWAGYISAFATTQSKISLFSPLWGGYSPFQTLAGTSVATFTGGGTLSPSVVSGSSAIGVYPIITF